MATTYDTNLVEDDGPGRVVTLNRHEEDAKLGFVFNRRGSKSQNIPEDLR